MKWHNIVLKAKELEEYVYQKDARQFHAFVSKTRSGLRKHYKVVVEENDEDVEESIHIGIWMTWSL